MIHSTVRLTSLTEREAIADTVIRAVTAYDLDDEVLLKSAITGDIVFTYDKYTHHGWEAVKKNTFDHIGKLITGHIVGNIRIELKSSQAEVAELSAFTISNHFTSKDGQQEDGGKSAYHMVGALYDCNLVKDKEEGVWKLKTWTFKPLWSSGDSTVMGF